MKAAVLASEAFRSTLVFFAVITGIASYVQLSRSESRYERVLNALNAFICSNACVALVYLAKYDDQKHNRHRGVATYALAVAGLLLLGFTIATVVELAQVDMPYVLSKYKDFGCYLSTSSPLDWTLPLAIVHMVFFATSILACLVAACVEKRKRAGSSNKRAWSKIFRSSTFMVLLLIISFSAIVLMWSDLVVILLIRSLSKKSFGDSYKDDMVGHGQIIAMLFCLEAATLFVYIAVAGRELFSASWTE